MSQIREKLKQCSKQMQHSLLYIWILLFCFPSYFLLKPSCSSCFLDNRVGGRGRRSMAGGEFLFVLVSLLGVVVTTTFSANVTYDHRALVVDGKRRVLVSGAIHYPRSTPDMWSDLIQKAKDGGVDVIETYFFWNLHEPVRGKFNFKGRANLVKFLRKVASAGLYVHLRIGPYACAEWNYGGFPLWLHFVLGITFRTDNEPFKAEMKRITSKIVSIMKKKKLFASQGGPIILSQVEFLNGMEIENEYGNVDWAYGKAGKSYMRWAAAMATSMQTGVPWVMCQQEDAPAPMISTCNGFYCHEFTPRSNSTPKMWTEDWAGWFLKFGDAVPYRPLEDAAYAVARFYQRGGTSHNYYMYHGGTNFGRTSGGPFITTSYDYDAPLDEYGLLRQPKWGHLRDLHKSIKLCEEAIVATDPEVTSLGKNLEVSVYKTETGLCSAFLANIDPEFDATVNFVGNLHRLPAWSVSILPDCQNVVYNTAKINAVSMVSSFTHQPVKFDSWHWVSEPVGISKKEAFSRFGLREQINTTADASDYLWYSLSIEIKGDEPFLKDGFKTTLHVESLGHVLYAFINGKLTGSSTRVNMIDIAIKLVPGKNKIDLLSLTVGLQNYGPFFDKMGAGITGPVSLTEPNNSTRFDLSKKQWTYQIGLKGEDLRLSSARSPLWLSRATLPKNQPLIWYKAKFDAPAGTDPIALNFTGMGKGEAWVNGQSIGRYWPTSMAASATGCTNSCDYRGPYDQNKCRRNCGKPSQEMYHVPRPWMRPSGNTLVLFEEQGGDPTLISFATKRLQSVCSHVSDSHPAPVDMWSTDLKAGKKSGPTLSLECPLPDQVISAVKFASYGTPQGTCGSFSHGRCSSATALSIVQKACIGSKSCRMGVSTDTFGHDPCAGIAKSLAVEVSCS